MKILRTVFSGSRAFRQRSTTGRKGLVSVIKSDSSILASNTLIQTYVKSGNIERARRVFESLPARDLVTWNTIIAGCSRLEHVQEGIKLFQRMQQDGVHPDRVTFVGLLKGCCTTADLIHGKMMHAHVVERGLDSDVIVGSSLMSMYARCGSLDDAQMVFDRLPAPDLLSWNTMIGGYTQRGNGLDAFDLFDRMQQAGFEPDNFTLVSVLKACSITAALERGKVVHARMIGSESGSDGIVGTALIDMYSQCGSIKSAREVFESLTSKDIVAWTAMTAAYAHFTDSQEVVRLYQRMLQEGIRPNRVTFLSILQSALDLTECKLIHTYIKECGLVSDLYVGSTLVSAYARCGSLEDARAVFDCMSSKNVVSWTAMLAGYAQHGQGQQALRLFQQMQHEGISPNHITLVSLLKACSSAAALWQGMRIHGLLVEDGLEFNQYVSSCVINMYSNCGSLRDGRMVFDRLLKRDLATWNAMIAGYAQHGRAQESLQLFQQMQSEGVQPCEVTFVCLLSACSHAGLVDEGTRLLCSMSHDFGISPKLEHYACMMDLLCRAGHLSEAEEFIISMPVEPDALVWKSFLGACQTYGNVELGRKSFEFLLKLDPLNTAAHVLMSNIYASVGRWEEHAEVQQRMQRLGIRKEPGCCWLEVDTQVHTFVVEDKAHPERKQIYDVLKGLKAILPAIPL